MLPDDPIGRDQATENLTSAQESWNMCLDVTIRISNHAREAARAKPDVILVERRGWVDLAPQSDLVSLAKLLRHAKFMARCIEAVGPSGRCAFGFDSQAPGSRRAACQLPAEHVKA